MLPSTTRRARARSFEPPHIINNLRVDQPHLERHYPLPGLGVEEEKVSVGEEARYVLCGGEGDAAGEIHEGEVEPENDGVGLDAGEWFGCGCGFRRGRSSLRGGAVEAGCGGGEAGWSSDSEEGVVGTGAGAGEQEHDCDAFAIIGSGTVSVNVDVVVESIERDKVAK